MAVPAPQLTSKMLGGHASLLVFLAALLVLWDGGPDSLRAQEPPARSLPQPLRAQLRAVRNPIVSSQMSGVITQLLVKDGDTFNRDQLLVQFDCTAQLSQVERARAVLRKNESINSINTNLDKLGSSSQLELTISAAEVAAAKADLSLAEIMFNRCSIRAPFSGRVVDLLVQRHQFTKEGQPLLEILDDRALEIELFAPSLWLRWLKPGHPFSIEVDETGKTYSGQIDRLSGKVDPVSHTIKTYGRLNSTDGLIAGMSGSVHINPPPP